jgi:hypothetical protein
MYHPYPVHVNVCIYVIFFKYVFQCIYPNPSMQKYRICRPILKRFTQRTSNAPFHVYVMYFVYV